MAVGTIKLPFSVKESAVKAVKLVYEEQEDFDRARAMYEAEGELHFCEDSCECDALPVKFDANKKTIIAIAFESFENV